MKKLLILLFSLIPLCVCAQMNRTIYGIALGSNIEEARLILESKGLTLASPIETKDGVSIGAINPYFSGIRWDLIAISSINGKVYAISFNRKSNDVIKEGNNALDLLQKLTDKYGMYEAASESGQTETFDGFNFQYVMIDELTRLTLYSEIHKYSECSITLVYVDKELRKIVESKLSDDL